LKLSQIRAETKPLVIPFQAGDLKVTYKPNAFTADVADKMTAQAADESQATDAFLTMVIAIIDSWDLEDDEGNIVPIEMAALRREVPMPVFGRIFQEIQKDAVPDEGKA
jgi:hypothetical protein